MLPDSVFYRFAKKNVLFIFDNRVYFSEKESVDLRIFEELYLSDLERLDNVSKNVKMKRNRKKLLTLAKFVMEDILGRRSYCRNSSEEPLIYQAVPNGTLIDKGSCYNLSPNRRGKIRINNRRYSPKSPPFQIEIIERKYRRLINQYVLPPEKSSRLMEKVIKGYYMDEKSNLGFFINNDDFYVCTMVRPYILYERINKKYYEFRKALIGSKLNLNRDKIEWNNLIVINNYSHPALPEDNRPFQKICVGSFDYDSIRGRGSVVEQVIEILYKGRKALTREYITPEKTWHSLIEDFFVDQEVKGKLRLEVTNL